jgi:hypothetical protein
MLELIDEVRASYDAPPSSNVEPSISEYVKDTDTDDDDDPKDDDASGARYQRHDDKDYISAPSDSGESDADSTDKQLVINEEKDPLCQDEPPILSDQNESSNEGAADDDIAVHPSTSGLNVGNFDALNPSNSDETPSPVSTIKSIFEVYINSNAISFYILFQTIKTSMSEKKSLASSDLSTR